MRGVALPARRAFCSRALLAAAAASLSVRRAAVAAPRQSRPFSLTLPPTFVELSNINGQGVLLMAGDFSNLIAETGAATTISVQRLARANVLGLKEADGWRGAEAAAALARLRDSQSGLPSGCVSRLIPSSLVADGARLGFELLTPLTCNGEDAIAPPPELSRHTLVRAELLLDEQGEPTDDLIVLFAGARESDWSGVGAELRAAAETFVVHRPQARGVEGAVGDDGGDRRRPVRPRCPNAHLGPKWAASDCA